MVRLKLLGVPKSKAIFAFQFLNGAIKMHLPLQFAFSYVIFQFLNGAIKMVR